MQRQAKVVRIKVQGFEMFIVVKNGVIVAKAWGRAGISSAIKKLGV